MTADMPISDSRSHEKAEELIRWFDQFERVLVAFSGGVDSSVALSAAKRSRCTQVVAVTAVSASVPDWQVQLAKQVAEELSVEHRTVMTQELNRPAYAANDSQRCFHCKSTLYEAIHAIEDQLDTGLAMRDGRPSGNPVETVIVSGTNHDDLGDYRPGIEAGRRADVKTPLADLGIGKQLVRSLATEWKLSNAQLPASPCLASRIAYGVSVTAERLQRIELAEEFLRNRGYREFRVRLHAGELARIEVARHRIEDLVRLGQESELIDSFLALGFQYVTVDLLGFRSGNLNQQLVNIEPQLGLAPSQESQQETA